MSAPWSSSTVATAALPARAAKCSGVCSSPWLRASTCGSAAQGGALGSFRPGEMVKEFEAYCFDPATELGALGVIDSEFGTHLVRLEKQNLGVEEGRARGVKGRRMLD